MPAAVRNDELSRPRDLCKALDRRLKNFTFTSITPKLDRWKGCRIAESVFDDEYNIKHFKSSEEQILWRLETWIDKCRITEYDENGVAQNNVSGKFHSAKRFRKSESGLSKVRSFSLGRAFSKSSDNLHKHEVNIDATSRKANNNDDEFYVAQESSSGIRIATSKSTSNLLESPSVYKPLRDASLDRCSIKKVENTMSKPSSSSKLKLHRFFAFAGKLKVNKNNNNKDNSANKKNENRYSAQFYSDEVHLNNNNSPQLGNQSKIRPSVLDVAERFGEHNSRGRVRTDRKSVSSVERSVSMAANSQTLFKLRNHNDSMKRVKVKMKNVDHPGNEFTGPVFYDPDRRESRVQTEICDV